MQAILDLQLQLGAFHNVDLYTRGFYQLRCGVRCSSVQKQAYHNVHAHLSPVCEAQQNKSLNESCFEKSYTIDECSSATDSTAATTATGSVRCLAVSKLFKVQFREEVVDLFDVFNFKIGIAVDSRHPLESLCRAGMILDLELYFADEDYSPSLASGLKVSHDFGPWQPSAHASI